MSLIKPADKKQLSMPRMTFTEAKANMNDQYSGLKLMSLVHHISLPPRFLNDIRAGIREQLNAHVNVYNESTNGVLVAYSNVKAMQQTGVILGDEPYVHFKVRADAVYFQPQVGELLTGVVNKVGKDHIGCLVHGSFNVSLVKPRLNCQVRVGDEVVFEVTQTSPYAGLLSINGKLQQSESNVAKRKRMESPNQSSIADAKRQKCFDKSLNLSRTIDQQAIAGSQDFMSDETDEKPSTSRNETLNESHLENSIDESHDVSGGVDYMKKKKKKKSRKHSESNLLIKAEISDTSYNQSQEDTPSIVKNDSHVSGREDELTKKKKKKHRSEPNSMIKAEVCDISYNQSQEGEPSIVKNDSHVSRCDEEFTKKKHRSEPNSMIKAEIFDISYNQSEEDTPSIVTNESHNVSGCGDEFTKKKKKKHRSESDSMVKAEISDISYNQSQEDRPAIVENESHNVSGCDDEFKKKKKKKHRSEPNSINKAEISDISYNQSQEDTPSIVKNESQNVSGCGDESTSKEKHSESNLLIEAEMSDISYNQSKEDTPSIVKKRKKSKRKSDVLHEKSLSSELADSAIMSLTNGLESVSMQMVSQSSQLAENTTLSTKKGKSRRKNVDS